MKSLAFFVFLFFAVPGSGQMVWDGIPFSTRAEFAALVILVTATLNHELRRSVSRRMNALRWRGAVKPALVFALLLKLLTFAWYPFGSGFEACYRSLYIPLSNPIECEKSYEGPFLRRSDLGLLNTSRIDHTIDFGTHTHDWSLPFMNEYPRLGNQWLFRFPFTAEFGATIENSSSETRYLPIYGNGEISGTLGGTKFDTANVNLIDRYQFPRIFFVEVRPGSSAFALSYRFSDDDSEVPPDEMPPMRGPYALLKVGAPQDLEAALKVTQLRIRGHALDTSLLTTPDSVIATTLDGRELSRAEMEPGPDVASFYGTPALIENGFNFTIPAKALLDNDVLVKAKYGSREITLGTLSRSGDLISNLPRITNNGSIGHSSSIEVWFDADRTAFPALQPSQRVDVGPLFNVIAVTLDLLAGLIVLGALFGVLIRLRKSLFAATLLGAYTFLVLRFTSEITYVIPSMQRLTPVILIVVAVSIVAQRLHRFSPVTYLPAAVVYASYKSFDHLNRFHQSRGERWWGRLLYYWRDSDWYATQGFARRIFVDGSLEGGESLFWFQSGPRYLAFVTRLLLGENDVLVGIIVMSLGFWAFIVLIVFFVEQYRDWLARGFGVFVLIVGLTFLSQDLIATFGFVGSSEYPTWILLFAMTGFIVRAQPESRSWLLVSIAFALAYAIQLRPNQIGGIILLLLVTLMLVDRSDTTRAITLASRIIVTFAVVVSLSLLHNLYYGESFVLFTANAGINYEFSWLDVLGLRPGPDGLDAAWRQLRLMMYWNTVESLSWAFAFWGSQLSWLFVLAQRVRSKVLLRARSLLLLIPFGYAVPMLKYQMGSYYPRHLVAINLAFMCAALMAWPREDEATDDSDTETTEIATAAVSN
jgi:hypothetical protein